MKILNLSDLLSQNLNGKGPSPLLTQTVAIFNKTTLIVSRKFTLHEIDDNSHYSCGMNLDNLFSNIIQDMNDLYTIQ